MRWVQAPLGRSLPQRLVAPWRGGPPGHASRGYARRPERAVVEAPCAISAAIEAPPQQPRYVIEDVVSRYSVDGVRRTVGTHMVLHLDWHLFVRIKVAKS